MTNSTLTRAKDSISDLVTDVRLTSPAQVEGHVFDPNSLDTRFVVELYVDGQPAALARAELYDDRLREGGVGDGCYRYAFAIDHLVVESASSLEVRIANSNRSLGSPIAIANISQDSGCWCGPGEVSWSGGLRFFGWLSDEPQRRQPEVQVFVDGICVERATLQQWRHIDDGAGAKAVRGFELHLPRGFADGRVRRANFLDECSRPLMGSPCAFFAFEDSLANVLSERADIASERIRVDLYDRCFPQSLPFDLFEEWNRVFPVKPIENQAIPKLALVLVGDQDAEATIASLETQVGVDWVAGILCGGSCATSFAPELVLEFLDSDGGKCEFVIFALSGTLFRQNALVRLVEGLKLQPLAPAAYCDVTMATEDGSEWPLAFPSFDYERMLEQGYCAYLFALPVAEARKAALAGASDLFRVFNIALDGRRPPPIDNCTATAPVHVPGFLAMIPRIDLGNGATLLAKATFDHLRARGIAATVEPAPGALLPRALVRRAAARAKVSLLIPTRNRVDLLRPCVESLRGTVNFDDHEVIVIDNDTSDPETLDYLEEIKSERVKVPSLRGSFNFARLINRGAAHARGDFVLVMNNSLIALQTGWLEEMLSRAAEPDVGVVGAAVLWPSGIVQHGGTVLGVGFTPGPAFGERIDGDPGYADQLIVAHECSAVAGDCLLTPRGIFLDVGGFDGARFPLEYHEVDYCLRLRSRGFRVVLAPRARLVRREIARNPEVRTQSAVARHELARLRSRWGEVLIEDPCYSPLLSLNGAPYSGLAWPPRNMAPRLPEWAPPRPLPPGF